MATRGFPAVDLPVAGAAFVIRTPGAVSGVSAQLRQLRGGSGVERFFFLPIETCFFSSRWLFKGTRALGRPVKQIYSSLIFQIHKYVSREASDNIPEVLGASACQSMPLAVTLDAEGAPDVRSSGLPATVDSHWKKAFETAAKAVWGCGISNVDARRLGGMVFWCFLVQRGGTPEIRS